ncbi:Gamma-tubulin complex component [Operophtera brumata]|uniref:Gamma-tubulin complex component n=1 Tax=Operophtera brumata TaxID=104452 RepID=A0A0L7LGX1_OPEBR|nr:Gamma-tubulin complex component [Operophtera brumata]
MEISSAIAVHLRKLCSGLSVDPAFMINIQDYFKNILSKYKKDGAYELAVSYLSSFREKTRTVQDEKLLCQKILTRLSIHIKTKSKSAIGVSGATSSTSKSTIDSATWGDSNAVKPQGSNQSLPSNNSDMAIALQSAGSSKERACVRDAVLAATGVRTRGTGHTSRPALALHSRIAHLGFLHDRLKEEWMVPSFMSREQAAQILATGKSVVFMREACADEPGPSDHAHHLHALLKAHTGTPLPTSIRGRTGDRQERGGGAEEVGGAAWWEAEGLRAGVEAAHAAASRRLLAALSTHHHLLDHLAAHRKYLLLAQGDFHHHLMTLLHTAWTGRSARCSPRRPRRATAHSSLSCGESNVSSTVYMKCGVNTPSYTNDSSICPHLDTLLQLHHRALERHSIHAMIHHTTQELQSYLGNVLNETLALRSFEDSLHAGIHAELARREAIEQVKAERVARGEYAFTTADEAHDKNKRKIFLQFLAARKADLNVWARSYRGHVTTLILKLALHSEVSLQTLAFRLDYSDFYKRGNAKLHEPLTYQHKRLSEIGLNLAKRGNAKLHEPLTYQHKRLSEIGLNLAKVRLQLLLQARQRQAARAAHLPAQVTQRDRTQLS